MTKFGGQQTILVVHVFGNLFIGFLSERGIYWKQCIHFTGSPAKLLCPFFNNIELFSDHYLLCFLSGISNVNLLREGNLLSVFASTFKT